MTATLDDTMNTAKKTVNDVKDTATHSASVARSTFLDGLHVAASTITMLRNLGVADALGWVGLQRRRGPMLPMLTFGAGFLAGAAAGILAAPMAGAEMRRRIAKRVMGMEHQAEETLAHAKSEIESTAKHAVHKAEDTAAQGASAVKDAVRVTFSSAEDAINSGHPHIKPPVKPPTPGHSMS